ncbi:hypothetical protein GGR54DRAFT_136297 [Hypoxylon sp. NC1633]|nr:hypothetical protein GGR54DRAFT_136297 [Hypoxylon sp. NC1633]
MSPIRDQMLETTKQFLDGYTDMTGESVTRIRSPTCTHRLLPATLKSAPTRNAEYGALVDLLRPVMPGFRMQLVDGTQPMIDEVARKVVLHATSRSETTVGLYENEYVWILTLSEDAKSVDDVVEFADSLYTSEWMQKLTTAAQEAGRK